MGPTFPLQVPTLVLPWAARGIRQRRSPGVCSQAEIVIDLCAES